MASNYINIPSYGSASWKDPVSTVLALPAIGNSQGDTRVVLDTGVIYEWLGAAWVAASSGGGGGSSYWKDPVATFSLLPTSGNTIGDVRLVLSNQSIWEWDGSFWKATGYNNVDGGTASRAFAVNLNINGGTASDRP